MLNKNRKANNQSERLFGVFSSANLSNARMFEEKIESGFSAIWRTKFSLKPYVDRTRSPS